MDPARHLARCAALARAVRRCWTVGSEVADMRRWHLRDALRRMSRLYGGVAMSAEPLPCCRCGKAPTVETYDGYPRVSCDCYEGPDAFCATSLTIAGAIQDWNERMEMEEPFAVAVSEVGK